VALTPKFSKHEVITVPVSGEIAKNLHQAIQIIFEDGCTFGE
jgi:hypothetical protein